MFEAIELAKVYRNELLESIHYGHLVLRDNNDELQAWGDADYSCFIRSCLKPIQAKVSASLIKSKISDEFLTLACASHLAEDIHLGLAEKISNEFSLGSELLRCGPKKFQHNCSGKHLAVLLACMEQGWSLEDYCSPEHPYNKLVKEELFRLAGCESGIAFGQDDCGLPSFHMSLKTMSKIFLNLINDSSYNRIISAMNRYPLLVAGHEQIDSLLMQSYPGKFISKGGAEGLMMIANLEKKEVLIVKIVDGTKRAKAVIASKILRNLNWIDKELVPASLVCDSNSRPVGSIVATPLLQ